MKQYEIILMIFPSHANQVTDIIQKYLDIVTSYQGKIQGIENWGRKQLSYPINKAFKAHYLFMNVTCNNEALAKIKEELRFDESIMRNSIIKADSLSYTPSKMMNEETELLTTNLLESLKLVS